MTEQPSEHACVHCGSSDLAFSEDKQGFGVGKAFLGAIVLGPLGLLAGGINRHKKTIYVRCNGCFKVYDAKDLLKPKATTKAEREGLRSTCGACGARYEFGLKACPSCGRSTLRNSIGGLIFIAAVLVIGGGCCFSKACASASAATSSERP